MDKLVYLSMTGAKAMMQRQDALANNLANAATPGFRADLMAFRAVPVRNDAAATTRAYALEATAGFDHASGTMQQTGRPLDVALRGSGWIAVQGLDGNEAYTRAGSLQVSADGTLQTTRGLPVLSEGGPIQVPANAELSVGDDGTINAKSAGQPPVQVGRIKLVDPPPAELRKGDDGLVRTAGGEPAPAEPNARLASGVLEASNVNVVEAMVGMIALSRQFELQMKMMQTADQNAQRAQSLLSIRA